MNEELPKLDTEKDKTLEEIKVQIRKLKFKSTVPVPKPEQKPVLPKSKSKYFYIPPLITLFISFVGFLFIIFVHKKIDVISVIFLILAIPLSFFSGIVLPVKLFIDRHKIKKKAMPHLTKNFIVANFLTNNMRIVQRLITLNKDGISFDIGNRTYIVDKRTIWYGAKNYPNSFYFPEIPNPIKFDTEGTINKFMKSVREQKLDNAIDFQGELVDISFSSTNLQLFKKNKIFDELNKSPNVEKTQLAMIGLLAFALVVILIAVIL